MNKLKVTCYDFFFYLFVNIEMSYYWFNRQQFLQKANGKYNCGGEEEAAKYCLK